MSDPAKVTRLLEKASCGDQRAADALLPLVYEQLRAVARRRVAQERPGHTLQATALVHEAYLRLVGDRHIEWAGRAHFFAAAAEAIRRILLDHARRRGRIKRGGGQPTLTLGNVADLAAAHDPAEILALDEAICRLEKRDPRMSRIVRLRFFAGLSVEETAQALGVSPRTVKAEWRFARMWLYRTLSDESEGEDVPPPGG